MVSNTFPSCSTEFNTSHSHVDVDHSDDVPAGVPGSNPSGILAPNAMTCETSSPRYTKEAYTESTTSINTCSNQSGTPKETAYEHSKDSNPEIESQKHNAVETTQPPDDDDPTSKEKTKEPAALNTSADVHVPL